MTLFVAERAGFRSGGNTLDLTAFRPSELGISEGVDALFDGRR